MAGAPTVRKRTSRPTDLNAAGFRFGAVLILTLAALIFMIAAPSGALTEAIGVLLTGSMLLAVAITSGGSVRTKRISIALILVALALSIGFVGSGELSRTIAFLISGLLAVIALPAMGSGLVRLLRTRGVTFQAVLGALAIYMLIALVFAYAIGAVAEGISAPYFAQANVGKGTQSQRAYFSVTTITTTGFGDLTPATRGGRVLTVLEELFGQIYLVTVVALLVANVGRRPQQGRLRPEIEE